MPFEIPPFGKSLPTPSSASLADVSGRIAGDERGFRRRGSRTLHRCGHCSARPIAGSRMNFTSGRSRMRTLACSCRLAANTAPQNATQKHGVTSAYQRLGKQLPSSNVFGVGLICYLIFRIIRWVLQYLPLHYIRYSGSMPWDRSNSLAKYIKEVTITSVRLKIE